MAKTYLDEPINKAYFDLAVASSDTVANASAIAGSVISITAAESDIVANRSDLTALHSDMFNGIRDSITAFGAMDTANVSDLVVGMGEILSALSDAFVN